LLNTVGSSIGPTFTPGRSPVATSKAVATVNILGPSDMDDVAPLWLFQAPVPIARVSI
jgi:hypothetical protein